VFARGFAADATPTVVKQPAPVSSRVQTVVLALASQSLLSKTTGSPMLGSAWACFRPASNRPGESRTGDSDRRQYHYEQPPHGAGSNSRASVKSLSSTSTSVGPDIELAPSERPAATSVCR
jgi:hypothetical protein